MLKLQSNHIMPPVSVKLDMWADVLLLFQRSLYCIWNFEVPPPKKMSVSCMLCQNLCPVWLLAHTPWSHFKNLYPQFCMLCLGSSLKWENDFTCLLPNFQLLCCFSLNRTVCCCAGCDSVGRHRWSDLGSSGTLMATVTAVEADYCCHWHVTALLAVRSEFCSQMLITVMDIRATHP